MPTGIKHIQTSAGLESKPFPSPILFISLPLPPHSTSQPLSILKFERDQIAKGKWKYFVTMTLYCCVKLYSLLRAQYFTNNQFWKFWILENYWQVLWTDCYNNLFMWDGLSWFRLFSSSMTSASVEMDRFITVSLSQLILLGSRNSKHWLILGENEYINILTKVLPFHLISLMIFSLLWLL